MAGATIRTVTAQSLQREFLVHIGSRVGTSTPCLHASGGQRDQYPNGINHSVVMVNVVWPFFKAQRVTALPSSLRVLTPLAPHRWTTQSPVISATVVHPANPMVRSNSARTLRSTSRTPASPAMASPYT